MRHSIHTEREYSIFLPYDSLHSLHSKGFLSNARSTAVHKRREERDCDKLKMCSRFGAARTPPAGEFFGLSLYLTRKYIQTPLLLMTTTVVY